MKLLRSWDSIQRIELAPHDLKLRNPEITEKIDGSQLCFLKTDTLHICSKNKVFDLSSLDSVDKMFLPAVKYLLSIQDEIPPDYIHYCEYLKTLRHVSLKYDRLPQNNLILWAVRNLKTNTYLNHSDLELVANNLRIDSIPLCDSLESISYYSDTEKVEGLIYTVYEQDGQGNIVSCAKYKEVSPRFQEIKKELKDKKKLSKQAASDKWGDFKDRFRCEARWVKAVQRLKEQSSLKYDMTDIGLLMKNINEDILKEELVLIEGFFRKTFLKELLKHANSGVATWYKERLESDKLEKINE